jgi:lipopolysaccharide transport system ATP-binding protein
VYADTGFENKHLYNLKTGDQYQIQWKLPMNIQEGSYSVAAMMSVPINLQLSQVDVCDFIPLACVLKVSRGKGLPIHGAAYLNKSLEIIQI